MAKKKLGERLVEAGLLTPEGLQAALDRQKERNDDLKIGEVLLELGLVSETGLLRFLAEDYKTRFVSTDKLAKVRIPSAILDRIPARMAEDQLLVPILWDDVAGALSVVMAEPQKKALVAEIQLLADAKQINAYIASRSAIRAAVKKHYFGDINAFADLQASAPNRADVEALAQYYDHSRTGVGELSVPMETTNTADISGVAPTGVRQAIDAVREASLTSDNDFLETLNVLIGLIELGKDTFKGHSAAVAKLTQRVCVRMGLNTRDTNHALIAAYLHDLGKKDGMHLTLPGICETDYFRAEAKRYVRTPSQLMESVRLPVEVNRILGHLYEAWDGSGIPQGVKGAEIALGARIIAAADAYEDFIRVTRDGQEEVMERDEAIQEMSAYAGTVLDPQVCEFLKQVLTGDLMRKRLLAEGQHILVVDTDPENTSLLDLKLTQKGYLVSVARDTMKAEELAEDGVDLVISETKLGGESGFALMKTLRAQPWGKDIPFVFLTSNADPNAVEEGMGLGAADYVVKPYVAEVFIAKVKSILDAAAASGSRGKSIRGNLNEMKTEDIVRILSEARRTGQVVVQGKNRSGEIFLEKGRVVNAIFETIRGVEAFTGILTISKGQFTFNPSVEVLERTIDQDTDPLIELARKRIAGS